MRDSITEFRNKQNLFNLISGGADAYSGSDLYNQYKLIVEEGADEGQEAFEDDNAVKLLDSFVDTLFVTLGALQKLEAAGFDVDGAMLQVANDNLTKFPKDMNVVNATIEKYKAQGINAVCFERLGSYVIMNSETSKVLKPTNFVSTDLSRYCPVKKISEIGVKQ